LYTEKESSNTIKSVSTVGLLKIAL